MAPPAPSATAAAPGRDLLALAVGVLAGFLSGLFGIGGGTVIVPGLVLVSRMSQRLAHGTSLAAIVPISLAGVAGFALEGKVDWAVAALLVAGSTAGALIGTRLLHRLPQHHLRMAFAAFLLVTAVQLVVDSAGAGGRTDLDVLGAVGLLGLGVAAGTLAGLLGVGGGIVLVPGQVLLFGIGDAVAKGTSLAVILPTAVVATRQNRRRDNVDLRAASIVGVAGVLTAFVASQIAVGLEPTVSAVLFALLLALVSLRLLWQRPAPGDREPPGEPSGELPGRSPGTGTGPGASPGAPAGERSQPPRRRPPPRPSER